jgi:hypothetical protein
MGAFHFFGACFYDLHLNLNPNPRRNRRGKTLHRLKPELQTLGVPASAGLVGD